MTEPELTITPKVMQEATPSETAACIIQEAAGAVGQLDRYEHYRFGSGYYVELPNYVNHLVAQRKTTEAIECVARCFEGKGIPNDLMRLMGEVWRQV